MSRSVRAPERSQIGSLRTSMVRETDEDLALFLEMRKREIERDDLLLRSSEVVEVPLGSEQGRSSVFDIRASSTRAPTRKNYSDDFLNSENDKNDYDWLLAPPGTSLFRSLEMETPRTVMNLVGTSKARPVALKSKVANTRPEAVSKSNLASRQPNVAPGLNTTTSSTTGLRRASASVGPGSTRPATPTRGPTLTSSSPKSTLTTSKPIISRTSKPTATTSSKPSRSSTPTSSRSTTLSTTKSTVSARPSSPQSRTTARSSTPTKPRPSLPSSMPPSRSVTPTRRAAVTNTSASSVKSNSAVAQPRASSPYSVTYTSASSGKSNSAAAHPRASSPTVKSRSWNPLEMPGFSLDAPPNLRTTLPDRPLSASRGRPGATNSSRSSSVEPLGTTGRVRRQSCSPSRGRTPNGVIHGYGSSVPAMSRLYAKANDNISPVLVGAKMVERVINMRKLAPPRQDDKHSPLSNLSGKSSSPDGSGFGRTISKKSLDMAIRHMDIRGAIPGKLRPLMANIPASSMYSVRSGHAQSRSVSVSDSPLATSSSNGSSEMSVNNWLCTGGGNEVDDGISSRKRASAGDR